MNALLVIARITSNQKIREYCAIKRHKQYQTKWAKEKAAVQPATDPLELTWD